MTSVFLVDDHNLLRTGMADLISRFEGYTVRGQAANGKELIEWIGLGVEPDIVILDIQMPVMNGEQTALWLKANRPKVKVLVLTMYDDEINIIRMIRAGASGYILKDVEPAQLNLALNQLRDNGSYHSDLVTDTLKRIALNGNSTSEISDKLFTTRELEFIRLACSDLTYKEIASKMNCSVRTVDGHRDEVFSKLGIKSRIGLALFAIKHNIVRI